MANKSLAKPSRSLLQLAIPGVYTRRINYDSATVNISVFIEQKTFISEWYFTKNHEIGSLVVKKVKKSWDSRRNRELGPALESKTFRHVYRLDESKRFRTFCLKVGHSNLKHSKSTRIVLWLLWNFQNQHIADRERFTTVVVWLSGAFVGSPLIYKRCLHLSDTFAYRSANSQ